MRWYLQDDARFSQKREQSRVGGIRAAPQHVCFKTPKWQQLLRPQHETDAFKVLQEEGQWTFPSCVHLYSQQEWLWWVYDKHGRHIKNNTCNIVTDWIRSGWKDVTTNRVQQQEQSFILMWTSSCTKSYIKLFPDGKIIIASVLFIVGSESEAFWDMLSFLAVVSIHSGNETATTPDWVKTKTTSLITEAIVQDHKSAVCSWASCFRTSACRRRQRLVWRRKETCLIPLSKRPFSILCPQASVFIMFQHLPTRLSPLHPLLHHSALKGWRLLLFFLTAPLERQSFFFSNTKIFPLVNPPYYPPRDTLWANREETQTAQIPNKNMTRKASIKKFNNWFRQVFFFLFIENYL